MKTNASFFSEGFVAIFKKASPVYLYIIYTNFVYLLFKCQIYINNSRGH